MEKWIGHILSLARIDIDKNWDADAFSGAYCVFILFLKATLYTLKKENGDHYFFYVLLTAIFTQLSILCLNKYAAIENVITPRTASGISKSKISKILFPSR